MKLNEQMLDTEVGRAYLDARFTLMALLIGNPEPLESLKVMAFVQVFEQAFGIKLQYGTAEIIDWVGRYTSWYRRNCHGRDHFI